MRGVIPGIIAVLMRRLFDMLRGIDMAIWGLIFVRAVGAWAAGGGTGDYYAGIPACWAACMLKATRR